jgi:hypothetical protein
MNHDFWRSFYRWLETARKGALIARRDAVRELLRNRELQDRDVIAAARRIIRLIDEEMVARAEVFDLVKGRNRR